MHINKPLFLTILLTLSTAYPEYQMQILVNITKFKPLTAQEECLLMRRASLPSFNESAIEHIINSLKNLVTEYKRFHFPITSSCFSLSLPPAPSSPWGFYRYINEARQFRKKLKEQLPTNIDGYQLVPPYSYSSIDETFKEQIFVSKFEFLKKVYICTITCLPIVACTESKLTPLIAMPYIALGTKCARKTTSFLEKTNIYMSLFPIGIMLSLNFRFIGFIALFTAFSGFWHFKKLYKKSGRAKPQTQ